MWTFFPSVWALCFTGGFVFRFGKRNVIPRSEFSNCYLLHTGCHLPDGRFICFLHRFELRIDICYRLLVLSQLFLNLIGSGGQSSCINDHFLESDVTFSKILVSCPIRCHSIFNSFAAASTLRPLP